MSRGFEDAGFEVLASLDNWKPAINVYKKNFKHPIYEQDLSNEAESIAIVSKYAPQIIMGGPPCQDFSSAGKRDETLGRADLTYSFANIVCAIRPQYFIMENVDRIRKSAILKTVTDQFETAGYGLSAVILDASYCGVPQARTRFFLIGELGGENNIFLPELASMLNKKPMTIRDYLGNRLDIEYYYRHPRNYSRRGVFSIDEPSPTVRGVNRPVPKGYSKHSGDPENIPISQLRPLTTIERSYLQTFPKNFIFEGTKTNLEQMIGNAVPINLAKFVALALKKHIENATLEEIQDLGWEKYITGNYVDFECV
jgi:DNA (cytosine-5)-methyltransferase 1